VRLFSILLLLLQHASELPQQAESSEAKALAVGPTLRNRKGIARAPKVSKGTAKAASVTHASIHDVTNCDLRDFPILIEGEGVRLRGQHQFFIGCFFTQQRARVRRCRPCEPPHAIGFERIHKEVVEVIVHVWKSLKKLGDTEDSNKGQGQGQL